MKENRFWKGVYYIGLYMSLFYIIIATIHGCYYEDIMIIICAMFALQMLHNIKHEEEVSWS